MAKRGPKPTPASEKARRGTAQPSRDVVSTILDASNGEASGDSVEMPDNLPAGAEIVWNDFAPMAEKMGTLKPADALSFGQWCVMSAHLQQAWAIRDERGGDASTPVPSSYIQQWRTLGEMFGLVGLKSRIISGAKTAGAKPEESKSNPFARNAR